MNERIRELVRQCGGYHKDDDGEETKIAILIGKEVEKFALLIVRECVDTVLDSSIEYTTRPQIAEELKEHFGVDR